MNSTTVFLSDVPDWVTRAIIYILLVLYIIIICVKNRRFKHTCNDDNDTVHSYITMSAEHDIVMMTDEIGHLHKHMIGPRLF